MNIVSNLQQLLREVDRRIGRGLSAAAVYLTNKTKEKVSLPAPRKLIGTRQLEIHGRMQTVRHYRAKTPATPGAYPRKLSGAFRRSLTWQYDSGRMAARFGTNIIYGRQLEAQGHRHISRVLDEDLPGALAAMAQAMGL